MQLYAEYPFNVDAVLDSGMEYSHQWFDCFDNQLQTTIENSTEATAIKQYVCDQQWQYVCPDMRLTRKR